MRPIDADEVKEDFSEILEHDYEDDYARGFQAALIAVLGHKTITPPPNDPLTLEELREMDGAPVWMTIPGENGGEWVIARNINLGDVCIFCPVGAKRQYGVDGSGTIGDYGKTWLAYRRKPEAGTK